MMNTFRLIKRVNAENIVIVMTRCDQQTDVDDAFIQERLDNLSSFANKCQLVLDPSKVIRFNNTIDSLEPMKGLLKPGNMRFEDNLVDNAEVIFQDLPEAIRGSNASAEQISGLSEAFKQMYATAGLRDEDFLLAGERPQDNVTAVAAAEARIMIAIQGAGGAAGKTATSLPQKIRGRNASVEKITGMVTVFKQMQAQHTDQMAQLSRDAAERDRLMQQFVAESRNASAEQQKMYQEQIGMLAAQMERANERAAQAARDAANAAAAAGRSRGCVVC